MRTDAIKKQLIKIGSHLQCPEPLHSLLSVPNHAKLTLSMGKLALSTGLCFSPCPSSFSLAIPIKPFFPHSLFSSSKNRQQKQIGFDICRYISLLSLAAPFSDLRQALPKPLWGRKNRTLGGAKNMEKLHPILRKSKEKFWTLLSNEIFFNLITMIKVIQR